MWRVTRRKWDWVEWLSAASIAIGGALIIVGGSIYVLVDAFSQGQRSLEWLPMLGCVLIAVGMASAMVFGWSSGR